MRIKRKNVYLEERKDMPMGNKYKRAAEIIERQQNFEKEQKVLHEKYNEPDNVIIKEKSNTLKFIIKMFRSLLKTIAAAILIILAAIGLIALIYPEPRDNIFNILLYIWSEFTDMIK